MGLDSAATTWTFVNSSNVKVGPFPLDKVIDMWNKGEIDGESFTWSWDANSWVNVSD